MHSNPVFSFTHNSKTAVTEGVFLAPILNCMSTSLRYFTPKVYQKP
jgi:hypothetical protein